MKNFCISLVSTMVLALACGEDRNDNNGPKLQIKDDYPELPELTKDDIVEKDFYELEIQSVKVGDNLIEDWDTATVAFHGKALSIDAKFFKKEYYVWSKTGKLKQRNEYVGISEGNPVKKKELDLITVSKEERETYLENKERQPEDVEEDDVIVKIEDPDNYSADIFSKLQNSTIYTNGNLIRIRLESYLKSHKDISSSTKVMLDVEVKECSKQIYVSFYRVP